MLASPSSDRTAGAAGESRSGRTGRPCWFVPAEGSGGTLPGAGLVPAAGRNRGGPSPAGAGKPFGRRGRAAWTAVSGGARGAAGRIGQAASSASAGSTSVQAARSAERVTASSTSWTCNASANDGVGSTPVATASTKSRIWWVKECS